MQMANSGHILIADDDETFLQSTADLLRREEYVCDCASDAGAVIEILRLARYDLLITDINMPGNTGLELIKNLPENAEGMPVILVTGNHLINTEIQSLQPPVVACMRKPLDFDKLLAQVRISMERK
jgi:DNA-binding NtrC family response regulator